MSDAPFLFRLRGFERLIVTERERVLVIHRGRISNMLGAGVHFVKSRDTVREVHDIGALRFSSAFERALFRERPDLVEAHLVEVRTGPDEIAVVLRDGRVIDMLIPDERRVFFRDAGPFEIMRQALDETRMIAPQTAERLRRTFSGAPHRTFEVSAGHIGVLQVDGRIVRMLDPGRHSFVEAGHTVAVRVVDMRMRTHEVNGQDILTKDRVTLRVNLTATFRVADVERAVSAVHDFDEALHRAVQLAFRKTLGGMTLDRVLAEKGSVDAEAAQKVRADMARIGLEVQEIALRDVILPGEMRDILTAVVAAEKEAEAGVIRRREETNATRSLLNTAKVMADNPVMLRLKELEALEAIAGKVERLTVTNGTEGLLTDVVRLRD